MAELDTLRLVNPTKKDFEVRFNGELYKVGAGEEKSYPEFLAFHIAKHLSDEMLRVEIEKIRKQQSENPYRPQVGQLMVYDNAKRRIALYNILGSKTKVEDCIQSYPFKAFIGEMNEYDEYVAKVETVKTPNPSTKSTESKE